ncbi:MAG: preprotein translocase subunit YajC [Coriobacteriia bacterium]|nr:preprotein translocase subunit YajC [Coriobacteriia bacterium]
MDQLNQLLPLVVLAAAFYLLIIRPQQKRTKDHRSLMESLAEGDRVVTIGGLYGSVRSLDDDRVGLEVSAGIVIEVARSAIARKLED